MFFSLRKIILKICEIFFQNSEKCRFFSIENFQLYEIMRKMSIFLKDFFWLYEIS